MAQLKIRASKMRRLLEKLTEIALEGFDKGDWEPAGLCGIYVDSAPELFMVLSIMSDNEDIIRWRTGRNPLDFYESLVTEEGLPLILIIETAPIYKQYGTNPISLSFTDMVENYSIEDCFRIIPDYQRDYCRNPKNLKIKQR